MSLVAEDSTGGFRVMEGSDDMFRTFATFEADFPDDATWDEHGVPIVPGGNAIADTIRESMMKRLVQCSVVRQHSFYGWAFNLTINASHFLCIIQYPGPWLVTCEPKTSVLKKLWRRGSDDDLAKAITILHEILSSDRRFSDVQWFTREDYEQGASSGADRPH